MTVSHGNQPLMAFGNVLKGVTAASDDAEVSYPADRLADGVTAWQAGFATGNGEVIWDLGSAVAVDAAAIAEHNLGAEGATITVYYSDTGTSGPWTQVLTQSPSNDKPALWQFTSVTKRYWRVTFTGHSSTVYIGDLYLGAVLELPAGMPVEWTSARYASKGTVRVNKPRIGPAISGLTFEESAVKVEITMTAISTSWIDSNWVALEAALYGGPFYFVGDSDNRATEVMFCWLAGDLPDVRYQQGGLYQQVTIQVEGVIQ